jgi:hypothetical protein
MLGEALLDHGKDFAMRHTKPVPHRTMELRRGRETAARIGVADQANELGKFEVALGALGVGLVGRLADRDRLSYRMNSIAAASISN